MIKLVLLDRDGVINVDLKNSVRAVSEFVLIPGAAQAIAEINQKNTPLAVVTNQAVVGRQQITHAQLMQIHEHMKTLLAVYGAHIDHIFTCTDVDVQPNDRRKPAPGMIFEAMNLFNVSGHQTVFVGDSITDLQAGTAARCQKILVKTGKGMQTLQYDLQNVHPFTCVDTLSHIIPVLT